jgi:hypothetical protein
MRNLFPITYSEIGLIIARVVCHQRKADDRKEELQKQESSDSALNKIKV